MISCKYDKLILIERRVIVKLQGDMHAYKKNTG